ncbi:MAG: hypothetical protein H0X12_07535 [Nocardioides sp.]|nr:hypothetical protein [Nocardioides sp.]
MRAPEGWFLDPSNTPDILAAAATDDDGLQGFGVVAFPGPRVTTDVHVKALLDQNYAKIDYERLPDTYLAGSKVYTSLDETSGSRTRGTSKSAGPTAI